MATTPPPPTPPGGRGPPPTPEMARQHLALQQQMAQVQVLQAQLQHQLQQQQQPGSILHQQQSSKPTNPKYGRYVEIMLKRGKTWVALMGNEGKNPDNWTPPDQRHIEKQQLRPDLNSIELKSYNLEPMEAAFRYEKGGSIRTTSFRETIERDLTLHGLDHQLFVKKGGVHLEISTKLMDITRDDIKAHVLDIKNCSLSYRDALNAGQYLLSSFGPKIKEEIIAGGSTNLTGVEVLFAWYTIVHKDMITVSISAVNKIKTINIEKLNLDYIEFLLQIQQALEGVKNQCPDEFEHIHMSRTIAEQLWVSESFYKDHVPVLIQSDILSFYDLCTTKKLTFDEFMTAYHPIRDKYNILKTKKEWHPDKNTPAKQIAGLIGQVSKLENELKQVSLLASPGNSGNKPGARPLKSSNGKYVLDGTASCTDAVWKDMTQMDWDIISALRTAAGSSRSGGGGGGGNGGGPRKQGKYPPITNRFAPNTATGTREAKDSAGNVLKDKQGATVLEYYCSDCKGESEGSKGAWTRTHGASHPTNKHDFNFRNRQREQQQGDQTQTDGASAASTTGSGAGTPGFLAAPVAPTPPPPAPIVADTSSIPGI